MNLTTLVTFGVGAILVYGAVKNKDPRQVVKEALGQAAPPSAPTPESPPAPTVEQPYVLSV